MRRALPLTLIALITLPIHASDLTLTRTFESTGPTGRTMQTTSTIMIHGQRSRSPLQSYTGDSQGRKTYGPRIVNIQQCDLKQSITLDLDNGIYSVYPLPKGPTRAEYEAALAKAKASPQLNETLTITTDVEDTGETRLLFGHTAHHYKIHSRREPSAGANAEAQEEFTDGWYISVPEYQQLHGCDPFADYEKPGTQHTAVMVSFSNGQSMNYRIIQKRSGPVIQGNVAADAVTATHQWSKAPDGSVHEYTSIRREKVTALSTASLDSSLFNAPHNYARVSEVKTNPTSSWTYRAEIAWAKFWNAFGI